MNEGVRCNEVNKGIFLDSFRNDTDKDKLKESNMGMGEAKEYPTFSVYPCYNAEQMPWAAAVVAPADKVGKIIWLSGATAADPETHRMPRNFEEERRGVGQVYGDIKEQTKAVWTRIKEVLEGVGAKLEDIVHYHIYCVNHDDFWDLREAMHEFWREYCPDLIENPRASTRIQGIKLGLRGMLVEIEVTAVTRKE